MNFKRKNRLLFLLLFLAVVFLVYLKSEAHFLHYCTPDSFAYLNHAKLISNSNLLELKGSFTTWPIGYPFLIALTSKLTSLSFLWSSKVVNGLFFLGMLFLLRQWFKDKANFVSLAFLTYGTLDILSFSWSETMFLFFVLLFVYALCNQEKAHQDFMNTVLFFVALLGLFLTKYLGLVFYAFAFIYLIKLVIEHGLKENVRFVGAFLLASIVAFVYLIHNYSIDGYLTGEPRFYVSSVHLMGTVKVLFDGLINELFLARKLYLLRLDWLFIILLFLQVLLLIFLFYKKDLSIKESSFNKEERLMLAVGGFYLINLVLLRLFIPLYDFDFRLLSPASLLVLISLLSFYSRQETWFKGTKGYVIAFFVFIYLFNFPKEYLLTQLGFM